jgi:FixJ family two-component response regulator
MTETADSVVYVVDDDEGVRRSLARLLRSVGLSVETFSSGKAFLEYPRPDRPACLVLDLRMPGFSGLDLQTALGENQPTIPIIFITGHGSVPISVRAMKGGALDFLQKPFSNEDLLDSIWRGLARSRRARAEAAERTAIERRLDTLTARERQVLGLVVRGNLNKQIAAELGAAEKTIKVHRGRLMRKMDARSVADLVRMTQKLSLESYQTKALSRDIGLGC